MFISPLILTILAGITGIIVFLALFQTIVGGVEFYSHTYMKRVGLGLRDSFFLCDPITLLYISIFAIFLMAIVGYIFMGIFGMFFLAILAGIFPPVMVRQLQKRHAKKFIYQLPDCLSGVASSLRSGASLIRSLEIAAQQQAPPLSKEFSVILSEYKMGQKLEKSLDDLYKRIPRPEIELLNSAIAISRSVGGDLAETIDSLASTLRERERVQGKIEALTAMGKMQGWISCFIPVLVAFALFKQEPEAMAVLFTEPIGWMTLAVLSIMMLLAIVVINKIVDIDV